MIDFDGAQMASGRWYRDEILNDGGKSTFKDKLKIDRVNALHKLLDSFDKEHKSMVEKFQGSNKFSNSVTLAWQHGWLPGRYTKWI